MARLTRRQQEEYIWVHYGIHRSTRTIQQVWQTRGGELHLTMPDLTFRKAFLGSGRTAQTELAIVFGLSDCFSTRVELMDSEYTKSRLQELNDKLATITN